MAILKGAIDFVGTIGGVSAYKRKDMDGTIVRTKGGASKRKVHTHPNFERTRENNSEFIGCGRTASRIRWALSDVRHLANYNFTADLTKLCKVIQLQDTENPRGSRSVNISKHRYMLEGFNLNQKNTFDSVMRYPLKGAIDRENGSALVQLPNLLPDINIFIPWKHPMYRFVISLQTVPDMKHNYPRLTLKETDCAPAAYSAWYTVQQSYEGSAYTVQLKAKDLEDDMTLILSVGIEMGMPLSNTVVDIVKYTGCAKILSVG
jgi:hypothetical protein